VANTKITTNVIADGAITSAKLDTNITISGDITGTLATAAQPNITSVGTLSALTVDDITINGSTISDAGDLTLDVTGNIILDADGGDVSFLDGGTETLRYSSSGAGAQFFSPVADKDIIFKGKDGSSTITALTLDMSDAGTAIFSNNLVIPASIYHTGDTNTFFGFQSADTFTVNTAGSERLRIDNSGNVGIGASSPASATGYTVLTLNNATNGGNLQFHHNGTYKGVIYNSSSQFRIEAGASTPMVFANPNGESMRIDSSGNVNVGGTANFGLFTVTQSTDTNAGGIGVVDSGNAKSGRLWSNGTNIYLSSGATGTGNLVLNEGGGNVGIGETSPDTTLHIKKNQSGANSSIKLENSAGANNSSFSIDCQLASSGTSAQIKADRTNSPGAGDTDLIFSTSTNGVSLAEAMRLDYAGNVLVGTTTSEGRLTVSGDASGGQFTALALKQDASSDDQGYSMTCDLDFYLWDNNTRISTPQARIGITGDGTANQNYEAGGQLCFYTGIKNNTSPNLTERMRLDSSGALAINGTNDSLNGLVNGRGHIFRANGESFHSMNDPGSANTLHVYDFADSAYRFYVRATGGSAGLIHATSTSITGLSDERLKENIKDLETGLNEVMALQPRRFDWKEGEGSKQKNVPGFIAQEVETVLPDLIGDFQHDTLDDAKSVKMGDMIPTLVKAIQEQQTIIDDLKSRIETLEG